MTNDAIEIDALEFTLSEQEVNEAIESASAFADEDKRDCQRVKARAKYEGVLMDMTQMLKAEKGNPMYGKILYKELIKKLKDRLKWLEDNPMEEPDAYSKKSVEAREEFAFLFGLGQLPVL